MTETRDGHLSLICDIGELTSLMAESQDIQSLVQQVVKLVASHLKADVGDDAAFILTSVRSGFVIIYSILALLLTVCGGGGGSSSEDGSQCAVSIAHFKPYLNTMPSPCAYAVNEVFSSMAPFRISMAKGFSMNCCMARFSGRAP